MKIRIQNQDQDQVSVMALSGDFTGDATDQFRRTVIERLDNHCRDFVIDLTAIDTLDSQALETLIWLDDCAAERLGQLRLAGLARDLQTVLHLTRLDDRLQHHDHVEDAIASLQVVTP